MKKITSVQEFEQFIQQPYRLVYFARLWCAVCHAMKPKVMQWLKQYPTLEIGEVNLDELPEISGQQLILSAPTLCLYLEGKELMRQAGYIDLMRFERVLSQVMLDNNS